MFADVKAAFAQSNKLSRPQGRLFVAPCEGVPLDEQDLIELVAPVYGLDDAPLRWFETVGNEEVSFRPLRLCENRCSESGAGHGLD